MSEVSRGEFDLLRQIVATNQIRLDAIDEHGTRGVSVVQVQLTEVIKDLAELKAKYEHDQEARSSNRKWIIGTVIASAATISGLVTAVFELLVRVH